MIIIHNIEVVIVNLFDMDSLTAEEIEKIKKARIEKQKKGRNS